MKPINRRLPASTSEVIHTVGTFIWLKSATGPVQIKTSEGETALLSSGDFVRVDREFSEFFVVDTSGAQNDLTFVISKNGEAGKYGKVDVETPNVMTDAADVTVPTAAATLIAAANSDRNELIITSLAANTDETRIGSSSIGAGRGIVLSAGATLFLNVTAAVYAYHASGVNQTYSVSQTEFS